MKRFDFVDFLKIAALPRFVTLCDLVSGNLFVNRSGLAALGPDQPSVRLRFGSPGPVFAPVSRGRGE